MRFGVMEEEGVGEDGAALAAGEGAHDGLAVAFGAGGPVVVGGEGDEGGGEGGEEDRSEDLSDAATGAELGDDLVGAGHFGEGVEDAEEDGSGGDGDEDEGDEMEVKEEHFADRSFGILEVFEAVQEVHQDVEGAEGNEAEEGGAEEVAQGVLVQEASVGVEVEAECRDEAGEADHGEFDEVGGGGGWFAGEGKDGGFEVSGQVGGDGIGGDEEAGGPDGADHAAGIGPGAEEGEVEDNSSNQEPHFEVGEEVTEDEDGDGGRVPTGAFEEFDAVAWGVVERLSEALPLHGEDDEDGEDRGGAADMGRRAQPSPDGGKDVEQRFQEAGHEPIGLTRFATESTDGTLGNASMPTTGWQGDKFAYGCWLEIVQRAA